MSSSKKRGSGSGKRKRTARESGDDDSESIIDLDDAPEGELKEISA
jgi:hypothetical protein